MGGWAGLKLVIGSSSGYGLTDEESGGCFKRKGGGGVGHGQ